MTNSTTSSPSPKTGLLPFEDTGLSLSDTRGPGRPVVYLNGAYADRRPWLPVAADLDADGDSGWRHIMYDERARGRSRTSADYSFDACLRDLDAVLKATGVARPLLVGWSYGAALGVHWAARNPGRAVGVVCVDGGIPYGLTGAEGEERIRRLFRRMGWMLPLVRPFGMAARMSAAQHAEVNIEANRVNAEIGPVLDRLDCPVRYVLATGGSLGGGREEMEEMRASLDPVLERNPGIRVSAKVPSNHSHVLRKDFRAVARAVRETAAAHDQRTR